MSMGVYIKGMEMPKNCYGCPFFKQVDYWNKNDEADILSKCKRTGEFTWESVTGYLPNCPLVPVPPHGRLIDADVLDVIGYCGIPQGREDTFDSGVIWLAEQMDELPTIIPAEEGE